MRARHTRSGLSLGSLLAISVAAAAPPAGLQVALQVAWPGTLLAQTAAPAGKETSKQIALSQQKIDNMVAAQKKVQDIESKAQAKGATPDQADAKSQKEIEGVVKSSGFASMQEFTDTMFSVGMVLSGMDPDSNEYVGTAAALQKEAAQVKADKKMPANEKKEVLDEIEAGIKSAPTEKPLPGNIDLVKANLSKLDQGQKAD